jgi:hypothetical protein
LLLVINPAIKAPIKSIQPIHIIAILKTKLGQMVTVTLILIHILMVIIMGILQLIIRVTTDGRL